MKIFLVHPRGAPNRPNAAYARREDLPLYSTRDDEVVELNVTIDLHELAEAVAFYSNTPDSADAWRDVVAEFAKLGVDL